MTALRLSPPGQPSGGSHRDRPCAWGALSVRPDSTFKLLHAASEILGEPVGVRDAGAWRHHACDRPPRQRLGSGLGVYCWVVEQTFALPQWFRRLRIRWEIRDDIHEAFLSLVCAIICWRRLHNLSSS